ncbi:MAG TPA: DNA primase [Solirubrobacteraceae bacterium]|nr:DNA primase [Solirubrobacteraceae bacterium]
MARFTKESIERVRDAADMVAVVSPRTELRRAGGDRWQGRCPFHDERTPSFGISPSKKMYHCFGCGAGGDVFGFVQETEGLDFADAVQALAERFNVELEHEAEDPQAAERRRRRERLHELLERTAAFYVRYLWESDEAARARAYLAERGLEEATLREFRVGYAPSRWDTVMLASQRSGFGAKELYDAGLVQRPRGGGRVYDRFRAQITFPLCDPRGRVLGFAGRRMDDGRGPKYLNSPEGDLFHKGGMVFGADLARAHAAKAGQVIAAEGYTDVLALHQGGLRNAVGIMGTALTEEQVGELSRLAPTVLLALDADSAGEGAMVRAAQVAAGRRLELRVVPLPEGLDPADLIARDGAGAMRAAVERSVAFVRFRVERALLTGDLSSAEGKDVVLGELRPVLAPLPASVLREELTRLIADRMDLEPEMVTSLLGRAAGRADAGAGVPARAGGAGGRARAEGEGEVNGVPPSSARPSLDRRERAERAFLAYCIALPALGREALSELEPERDLTGELSRRVAAHLREHLDQPTADLPNDDPALGSLLAELTVRADRLTASPAAFEAQRLQLALARSERELAAARSAGTSVAELARRREELRIRFDAAIQRANEEGSDPDAVG